MKIKVLLPIFFTLLCIIQTNAAVFVVDNIGDADNGTAYNTPVGANTLRKCIRLANAASGSTINFSVNGPTVMASNYPNINVPITIDGSTAPSGKFTVDGNNVATQCLFLTNTALGSTIKYMVIGRSADQGIFVNGANNVTIDNCYIGIAANGTTAMGNTGNGILAQFASGIKVTNCLASCNGITKGAGEDGIRFADVTNSLASNNKCGTDITGLLARPNDGDGIRLINAPAGCQTSFVTNNLCSGNNRYGIEANLGKSIRIYGNLVGTDGTGTAIIPNHSHGIYISNSDSITIGGSTAAKRNICSGNGLISVNAGNNNGISFDGGCTRMKIQGNYCGLDINGANVSGAMGNESAGISFAGISNSGILNNYVSNNTAFGIWGTNGSNIAISGNTIGLDGTGSIPMGNKTLDGLYLDNITGTTNTIDSNIVADNKRNGINIAGQNFTLYGNIVGFDKTGKIAFGNVQSGIYLASGTNLQVGGSALGQRNIVGNNGSGGGHGIQISNPCTGPTTVEGNYIGLDINGTGSFGNKIQGIEVDAPQVTVKNNIIGHSGSHGIQISGNPGNANGATVIGNISGFEADGITPAGNSQSGIIIIWSSNNIIGVDQAGKGNLLGNNGEMGIHIVGGSNNTIYNNKIGVDKNGNGTYGNHIGGIFVDNAGQTSANNIIGGAGLKSNIIANNQAFDPMAAVLGQYATYYKSGAGFGVVATGTGTTGTLISMNSIYCNAGLGIDLNKNDNFMLNAPGNTNKATPTVDPLLTNSTWLSGNAGANDAIEVFYNGPEVGGCDCEGKKLLGTAVADGAGKFKFDLSTSPVTISDSSKITVTATDAAKNTSQFAKCCRVEAGRIKENNFTICQKLDTALHVSWHVGEKFELMQSFNFGPWTVISSKPISKTAYTDSTWSNISFNTVGSYRIHMRATSKNNAGASWDIHENICVDSTADLVVTVIGPPSAGTDGISNQCPKLAINMFSKLGGGPYNIGKWYNNKWIQVSPTNTYNLNPAVNKTTDTAGVYHYVADNGTCKDTASVTVSFLDSIKLDVPITTCNLVTLQYTVSATLLKGIPAQIAFPASGSWTGNVWTSAPQVNNSTYNFTFQDNNACNAIAITGTRACGCPTITIDSTVVHEKCNTASTGSIVLSNPAGGTNPYTYKWNDNSTAINLSNIPKGNYAVTVYDANLCTVSAKFTITEPSPITILMGDSSLKCNGDLNGALKARPTGGTKGAGYTYLWPNGSILQIPNNLTVPIAQTTKNYIVTVTDGNLCTATQSANLTQPTKLTVSVGDSSLKCNGDLNGALKANVSGGTIGLGYKYQWTGGSTLQMPNNLTVLGTTQPYTVTVTDGNNCTASKTANLTQPTKLIVSVGDSSISCNGGNGTLKANVSGGTIGAGYKFSWTNGSNLQMPTNLTVPLAQTSTTYTVTVTDKNSCTNSVTANLTQPTILTVSMNDSSILCWDIKLGSLKASPKGGVVDITGYKYSWINGSSLQAPTDLPVVGTTTPYTVTVTDKNLCTATISANIIQPMRLTIIVADNSVSCYGNPGSLTPVVQGGILGPSAVYNFKWSDGSTLQNPTTLTFTGTSKLYTVTVSDVNGCTESTTATLSQPPHLEVSVGDSSIKCNGFSNGALKANVIGGTITSSYQYLWTDGYTTQMPNTISITGTTKAYTVTVKDDNGCSASNIANITQPQPLTFTKPIVSKSHCTSYDGSIVGLDGVGGNGGYTILPPTSLTPDPLNSYPNNLKHNTFTITVKDILGCTSDTTIVVGQIGAINVSLDLKQDVSCNGGKDGKIYATITPSTDPNFSYQWMNTTLGTNYPVKGGIALPVDTLSNLLAGNYAISVTDAKGCTATSTTITVSEPQPFSITVSGTSQLCSYSSDGKVEITSVIGGTIKPTYPHYVWQDNLGAVIPPANLSSLSFGMYYVTATDANNCTFKTNVQLTQPSAITLFVPVATSPAACGNSVATAKITPTGGTPNPLIPSHYTYLWSNNQTTQTATGLSAALSPYTVTVKDLENCVFTTTVTIVKTDPPIIDSIHSNDITCNDTPGDATVYVKAGSGTVIPVINYNYSWSSGSVDAFAANLENRSYEVTVSDKYGCTATKSVFIGQKPKPTVTLIPTPSTCFKHNGSIIAKVVGAIGNVTYNWAGYSSVTQNTLTNLQGGNKVYKLDIIDQGGCTASNIMTVTNQGGIFAEFDYSPKDLTVSNANVTFTDMSTGDAGIRWFWDYGDGKSDSAFSTNIYHYFQDTGTYSIKMIVQDKYKCDSSVIHTLTVKDIYSFFIPNAFSPNSDGANESFIPYGSNLDSKSYTFRIFNRWGNQIFYTNDLHEGWNGRMDNNGKDMSPEDVYIYYIKVSDLWGSPHEYVGHFSLIY